MYKKRFAKWGFQKNSRRSATAVSTLATKDACRRLATRKHNPAAELGSMPASLQLGHDDGMMLSFLTSVRKWSVAFFESVSSRDGPLARPQQRTLIEQPWSEKAKETSFTLKLVSDLLDRGHGALAGRIARKAFLLVEDILTLEGPALIWNLLEMMYHMVTLRQEQLFQILLAHLIALINGRVSKTHPLSAMLHDLRRLVASLTSATHTPGSSSLISSSSSLPSPSTDDNGTTTTAQPGLFSRTISHLLEDAWVLNAEMLFDHFDLRLSQLYFHLHWESCSIGLPSAIIGAAKQWMKHIETQQMSSAVPDAHRAKVVVVNTLVEEERMLHRLLAPRMDASPPQTYEMLRTCSVAALLGYGNSILGKGFVFNGDSATILRIMPALIKAKTLEESAAIAERSRTARSDTTKVSRSQAGNVACVVRALIDLNAEHGGDRVGALPDAVERIRSLVALREYAYGEIDPQVMREMWLLEDALAAAGERAKAQEVQQSVIRRLEKYTQDIAALDSV